MSEKLTTYKDPSKQIKVEYFNGKLHRIEIQPNCKPLNWHLINEGITFLETDLTGRLKKVKTPAIKEKLALFCTGYKAWTLHNTRSEIAYKVSKADAGMIKNVIVTQELLQVFFLTDFWTKDKSISNYVKHFNEIQRIAASSDAKSGSGQHNKMGQSLNKWFG